MDTRLEINKNKTLRKMALCLIAVTFIHFSAFAGETTTSSMGSFSILFNPLFIALLVIAILLLIAIIVFADVVKAAAYNRMKKNKNNSSSSILRAILLILSLGMGSRLAAQNVDDSVVRQTAGSYLGLDGTVLYTMLSLIGLELLIVGALYGIARQLMDVEEIKERKRAEKARAKVNEPTIIEILNASVAIENEHDIMLDHDYDGIRELDNNLPPWWKYGFYCTIVFAFLYLVYFHISGTGKLQIQEYEDQLTEAKLQLEEYKKKSANLVDENNATLLVDQTSLESGKAVFMDNCVACHGRSGEGGVGPNLTDDYWLHEGGVKNIFKSIKYGWPEKGMKAWQQDLGAKQIHEIASYIVSLHGTNPANAKEKQGELYIEKNATDSTKIVQADSLMVSQEK